MFDTIVCDVMDANASLGQCDSIIALLQRAVDKYGLRNAAYLAVNLPNSHPKPYISATYSDAWVSHYREQGYHKYDPVVVRGFDSLLPIDWAHLDRSTSRARQIFNEAKDFGVGRHGLSFPIRGRLGERAILSVTADETDQAWLRIRRELARDFQIFAYHVHRLVLSNETVAPLPVRLAPREIDCLSWAAHGKTQIETATILGISERTVICYLETARHKLDAMNTTHAVAKSIAMNIISVSM